MSRWLGYIGGFAGSCGVAIAAILFWPADDEFIPVTYGETSLRYDPIGAGTTGLVPVSETQNTYAVRSDGSTVEVVNLPHRNGEFRELRRIVDLRQQVSLTVDDSTMSKISSPVRGGADQPPSCRGLETEMEVLGYRLLHTTVESDGFLSENYVAPELGCITLLSRTYAVSEGEQTQHLTREDRVNWVQLGEPDDSLFAVSNDYVERTPAEFVILMAGEDVDPALLRADPFVQGAEENYRLRSPAIDR